MFSEVVCLIIMLTLGYQFTFIKLGNTFISFIVKTRYLYSVGLCEMRRNFQF